MEKNNILVRRGKRADFKQLTEKLLTDSGFASSRSRIWRAGGCTHVFFSCLAGVCPVHSAGPRGVERGEPHREGERKVGTISQEIKPWWNSYFPGRFVNFTSRSLYMIHLASAAFPACEALFTRLIKNLLQRHQRHGQFLVSNTIKVEKKSLSPLDIFSFPEMVGAAQETGRRCLFWEISGDPGDRGFVHNCF